jgi:hypothetical protein
LTFTAGYCQEGMPASFMEQLLDDLVEEIVDGTRINGG